MLTSHAAFFSTRIFPVHDLKAQVLLVGLGVVAALPAVGQAERHGAELWDPLL